eukprot:PITA_02430
MPLQPQVHLEPFEKWALEFIGPIKPTSNGKKYILVCIDYVIKWAEAKALVRATEHTVVNFLFEEIFVRITWKDTTGFTPYDLVYDKEVMLPIEFQIHTFKLAADLQIDLDQAQKERIQQLNQLDEMRQQAEEKTILMQKQRKQWHDAHIKKKQFKEGDWALLFDSKFRDHKASLPPIGWAPTKLFRFMTMVQ